MGETEIDSVLLGLGASLGLSHNASFRSDYSPVLIYGAGNVGRDVLRLLVSRGYPVVGFLDLNAAGSPECQGFPVWLPSDPKALGLQRKKCHVVISIFNYHAQIACISRSLRCLGYTSVSTFLQLHGRFAAELGDRYWLTSLSFYQNVETQLREAFGLLEDRLSRETFLATIKGRFSCEEAALPQPIGGSQYFAAELPKWSTPLRFVDCGAFNGDTLREIVGSGMPVEAVAAFEPDPANFLALASYVYSEPFSRQCCLLLSPCGVHSTTEQLRFTAGQGTGSQVCNSGGIVIQAVSLDHALPGFRPTLIKMDIEGAEYAALCGARKTIHDHRPGLAICVYHRPEHLWQIALLLDSWDLGYKFYLRAHAFNGFETVLYAYAAG